MSSLYVVTFSGVSSAAAIDLVELDPLASLRSTILHEIYISQLSDVGANEEEMLLLQLARGGTSGSGGSTGTENPLNANTSATSNIASEYGNTTQATGTTALMQWYWNIRIPFHHIFTPESRPVAGPGTAFVLSQETTPTDSITYGGYVIWEEI